MGEKMLCGYEPSTSKMALLRRERERGTSPVWDQFYTSFN